MPVHEDESVVRTERRGSALHIILNRPDRGNALNEALCDAVREALRAAQADPDVRVLVLTGAGTRTFCAGGDLAPSADGAPFTVDPADPHNFVVRLFKAMEACALPIVGRVNGHALAGGLGLLCACDLAVAADHATFGTPEARIGLFPMMILPQMLRVLPFRTLMEMCLTGRARSAQEALAAGLVNHVVPAAELDARVDALVEELARVSPTAIRLGKHGLHAMRDMTLGQAWEFAELMLPMMAQTQDAREGFRAFQEKRTPEWTGR